MTEAPAQNSLSRSDRRRLKRLLKHDLNRHERVFCLLRLHENMSIEQAGDYLGITRARVHEIDASLTARAEAIEREKVKRAKLIAQDRREKAKARRTNK